MSMDDKDPNELLGDIRNKLLPLVETEGNIYGDMRDCTASAPRLRRVFSGQNHRAV